ncbi:MAG: ABC transporter ATP-binding protein [Thermofilum sp.]|jgi:ABC-2 type transport system ATP-binding protein|nr:ABC transporter ATP-binding protein [Thermofilum sp.]
MEFVIETEGLVKIYRDRGGETVALDGVDMKVPRGVLFGLFGPNGSGKSTLISILIGLTLPTKGTARVLGFDSVRESIEIRKRVGVLPENFGFYEHMSAYENLEYLAMLDGIPESEIKSRIMSVLEVVGLRDKASARVAGFSRGMVQRLAIAQALLKDPELLILDEPTIGLDPSGSEVFRGVLRDLVKQGRTVLVSTHLLRELGYLCTHAALIRQGKIIAQGHIDDLSRKYSEVKGYAFEVIVSRSPEEFLLEAKQRFPVPEASLQGNRVILRTTSDLSKELSELALKYGLVSLNMLKPEWDEIYTFYQGGGWNE